MSRYVTIALVLAAVLAAPALADEMWKAKGPATSFVPDWSNADKADAEATAQFLKEVWPKLKAASESLHAGLKVKTDAVYAGALTDAEKAAGVACFALPVEQVLPWYAVPGENQVKQRTIAAFAARGQSEAVCVGVHALADAKAVTVTCSDLKGPGVIPAAAITSRLSLSYTMDPRGKGSPETRQMVLLKVDSWDIPKARTYEWVIDVHTPADAKPGKYAGKIAVTVAGNEKPAAEFALEFEVLPFQLTDNGCRWGAFMTPWPSRVSDAWADLNARYGYNTLAHWKVPQNLDWTWDGAQHEELILAKVRDDKDDNISKDANALTAKLPEWVRKRKDGPFLVFKPSEVVGLPSEPDKRAAQYKKQLQLKPELGELTPEQAKCIRYDRTGQTSNFTPDSFKSTRFVENDEFKAFDAGMKRLTKFGFAGPITWFGAGGPPDAWETIIISGKFGQKYRIPKQWVYKREVTEENSNHTWYMANAAVAKTFDEARKQRGWPEVVWCPCDESFQYHGASGRAVSCMMGELMPYMRKLVPDMRVYTVVWHKKGDKGTPSWQCGTLQQSAPEGEKQSDAYGPYHVICTNCPNDLDRGVTWKAGGEYWVYCLAISTVGNFGSVRYGMGLNGARHYAAVSYNFADHSDPLNLPEGAKTEDVLKSLWITGQFTTNYYLSAKPAVGESGPIDRALASHTALAIRAGATDRKYWETLRTLAYAKNSADDIAFINDVAKLEKLGGAGKGGVDDFIPEIKDDLGVQKLRRELADRIAKLSAK